MRISKRSLANAVIYSIISLVYACVYLYTGKVGLGKYLDNSIPLIWFTVLGVIIIICSLIVQIAIVSHTQNYDEFQLDQLLRKALIGLVATTTVMLLALLMVAFFDVNTKIILYTVGLIHWIFITILEISFIIQLNKP